MGKSGGKGAEAPGDGGAEVGARLESLFATLEEQLRAFAVHKALHTCDQILALAPADPDALHAKVAALVHADQCAEALAVLHAQPAVAALMPFEKAYCLYRTARHKEALALLQDSEQIPAEHTAGATHLRAQLQYRAGAFDDCIRTYESAQQAGQLDSLEARTNLVAAYISAGRSAEVPALMNALGLSAQDGFEVAYNSGCAALAQGRLRDARQDLLLAQRMGREALLDEDYTEEEVEQELLPISVQLAHLGSLQGRKKEAADTYTRLLKLKPTDVVSGAVAANNLLAERGAHELFDGLKRLDKMLERGGAGTSTQFIEVLESRLTEEQKQALAFNRATLLLHSNKTEQCRDVLATLATRFPDSSAACLLNAALLVREKRVAKADELLAAFAASQRPGAGSVVRVHMMRAQLAAVAGDAPRALASLGELAEPLRFAPRLVATCVALQELQGAPERGEEVLDAALSYWDTAARSPEAADEAGARATTLARAAADYKRRAGRHAAAVTLHERLLQGATTEEARVRALEGLVLACAHTDLAAAERHAALITPPGFAGDLDAEELEMNAALGKQAGVGEADAASRKRDAEVPPHAEQRARKRRTRKPRYPKGFDPAAPNNPPPDPERWLPRRERAAFKGKRRAKAQQLRGAQGATPAAAAALAAPGVAAVAAPPPPESKGKGKKGRR